MLTCEICKKSLNTLVGLSLHINTMHPEINKKEYYLKYLSTDPLDGKCHREGCNNNTTFRGLSGYHRFCSIQCVTLDSVILIKIKNTFIEKYGQDCALKIDKFKDKAKATNLKRFGSNQFFGSDIGKQKVKERMLEKYGVDNPTKSEEIQDLLRKKNYKKMYDELLNTDRLKNMVKPLFSSDEYKGKRIDHKWKCIKCETEFEDSIDNGKIPRCPTCFPYLYGTSKFEQEIFEFTKQYFPDSENLNKTLLSNNYELDIYIQSIQTAIECDGLYWHSESFGGKDKNYHLNKTNECLSKGIQLIHIFEDEWINKQQIIQSILLSKFGLIKNKIYARKCKIKFVDNNTSTLFLDNNHLQGSINGNHIGLYYNNELVSLLTYGPSRFNKEYEIEILRFCNKLNTIVIGGLSKLINKINSNSIITYVDRRYGNGESYKKCGFKLVSISNPSYYYLTDNYTTKLNRMKFQKHKLKEKLETYDDKLTEWQNMVNNGYDRIWDCGNLVYELIR